MTRFEATQGHALDGALRYSRTDYAFRFEALAKEQLDSRAGDQGVASIAIGTLQIEVSVQSGLALYVWGLHPHSSWQAGFVDPGQLSGGAVRVVQAHKLVPGIAERLAGGKHWTTTYDGTSGWLQVAETRNADCTVVLIATGIGLGIDDGALVSIWLRPTFED